jgi:hypothetical protein
LSSGQGERDVDFGRGEWVGGFLTSGGEEGRRLCGLVAFNTWEVETRRVVRGWTRGVGEGRVGAVSGEGRCAVAGRWLL